MRKLTIKNKEYTFKFSIEASLYNECTESVMNMLMSFGELREAASENASEVRRKMLSTITNIPKTALTLFYAGLMEFHGYSGDNSVRSINDAKSILTDYVDESGDNLYDVMNLMLECMGEDHFFDLTGLSEILSKMTENGESEKKSGKKKRTGEG